MCQPRVLVVTSCTGQKRFKSENQLTLEDCKDKARLQQREAELAELACPANQMYTGQQHLRVMEGVGLLRQFLGREAVDVVILSAGYGLIPEDKTIVPYQVTFNKMKGYEIDEWAAIWGIRQAFERAIADYDLVFLLLGENYLRSLSFPVETSSTQTLVFLASKTSAKYIRQLAAKTLVFTLSNVEAKRYRYGLVGLKGLLFKRFAQWVSQETQLLQKVYQEPEVFRQVMEREPVQLELLLELPKIRHSVKSVKTRKKGLSSTEGNIVNTKLYGRNNRILLKRSDQMESLVIEEVNKVLTDFKQKTNRYEGLIYMMYWLEGQQVIPLYIGKSEKYGKKGNNLSSNIKNISHNKSFFCRWGDNYAYHIGDLSAVVCLNHPKSKMNRKYEKWADRLFESYPTLHPTLRRATYFWIHAWENGSVGIWKEFGSKEIT